MDCYIVRIYRRMTNKDHGFEEAVGLLERVENSGEKIAFSSYAGLLNLLQGNNEGGAVITDGTVIELLDQAHSHNSPD